MFTFSQSSLLTLDQPAFASSFTAIGQETVTGKDALQHTPLYTSAYVDVAYNRLHEYLYCNWKGMPAGESLQEEVQVILTLLKGQGCSTILNDNRQAGWALQAASRWVKQDLFAPLRAAGLHRMAWVVSPNPLLHLATLLPLRRMDEKCSFVRTFSDESAAKLWLLERLN
jgi:hypothetical protein